MSSTKKMMTVRFDKSGLQKLKRIQAKNRWLRDMTMAELIRMALDLGIEKISDDTDAENEHAA